MSLPWGQVVGYLGQCVGLYFGSLLVWTLLKRRRPKHAKLWMNSLARWNSFRASRKHDRGSTGLWAAIAAAGMAIAVLFGYGMRSSELHANIVDTYYDVYVISNPDGQYNYWLEAHDASGKLEPRLYLHFCNDFEPEFSPGQTLDILNVEHKYGCVSVANTHPGYRIRRAQNGVPEKK